MFNVIIGNPPDQKKVGEKKTQAIWMGFVVKSDEYLKDNGDM